MKTTNSKQVWQAPTGDRKIWEVTLQDEAGAEYRLKTYSDKISQLGFAGEVKSYLNQGGDRFVRHVPEQKSPYRYERDDDAIRAQWAIGQAINLASVKMNKEDITLPIIEKYAKELFATVSRVKGEKLTEAQLAAGNDYISSMASTAAAF